MNAESLRSKIKEAKRRKGLFTIGDNDTETERDEVWDLIAPAKAHVREAMDEEDGFEGFGALGLGEQVGVGADIEVHGPVLDSWVVGEVLVDHFGYYFVMVVVPRIE